MEERRRGERREREKRAPPGHTGTSTAPVPLPGAARGGSATPGHGSGGEEGGGEPGDAGSPSPARRSGGPAAGGEPPDPPRGAKSPAPSSAVAFPPGSAFRAVFTSLRFIAPPQLTFYCSMLKERP